MEGDRVAIDISTIECDLAVIARLPDHIDAKDIRSKYRADFHEDAVWMVRGTTLRFSRSDISGISNWTVFKCSRTAVIIRSW